MKKEIRKRVISIFITCMYFVLMTILSVQINNNYTLAAYNSLRLEDISVPNMINLLPIADEDGLREEPYVFKVINNSSRKIKYVVSFTNDKDSNINTLDYKYLRYSISTDNINYSRVKNMNNDGYLDTSIINSKENQVYYLKFWIDYSASEEVLNKTLSFNIQITQFDSI